MEEHGRGGEEEREEEECIENEEEEVKEMMQECFVEAKRLCVKNDGLMNNGGKRLQD